MSAILKVALRSVKKNIRRMFLIGIAIFGSSFLLLFVCAIMNGAAVQTVSRYRNIQTGDAIVMWKSLYNTSNSNVERFIDVYESLSFKNGDGNQNDKAIDRMSSFLSDNKNQIEMSVPTIRRNAQIDFNKKSDAALIIYSIKPESEKYIISSSALNMKEGKILSGEANSICISESKAKSDSIKLNDKIKVEALTVDGKSKTQEFTVTGIYADGAFYDDYYGFVSYDDATRFFGMKDGYFDICKVFLKEPNNADNFAESFDTYLKQDSPLLRVQSYKTADTFFPSISNLVKIAFGIFIVFLLLIIAIGLRSTVRLNIMERMKEFGTFRAIGFSRRQVFCMIFFEILFVSCVFLFAAIVVAVALITVLGNTGIFVGQGPSSILGGESVYPLLKITDIIAVIIIILLFSLISTFGPGLDIVYQKISDIMVRRRQKVHPIIQMIKEAFN